MSFDVAIVSIPQCCGFAHQEDTSDDEGSLCSCGNTTSSYFSDMEHTIAKGKVIDNLVVVPEQLNKSKFLKNTINLSTCYINKVHFYKLKRCILYIFTQL